KYNGLYLNGDKVVLSYMVGKVQLLEMLHGRLSHKDKLTFQRTMLIGPSESAMELVVLTKSKSDAFEQREDQDKGLSVATIKNADNEIQVNARGVPLGSRYEVHPSEDGK